MYKNDWQSKTHITAYGTRVNEAPTKTQTSPQHTSLLDYLYCTASIPVMKRTLNDETSQMNLLTSRYTLKQYQRTYITSDKTNNLVT